MARDGIRQARAQHHELMLPIALRSAHCSPHGIVQTPELALGAAIHIAHASHDGVRVVIQVQTVGDQLVDVDFRRRFERTPATGTASAVVPPVGTAIRTGAARAISGAITWAI
jgi:hypothetical protein